MQVLKKQIKNVFEKKGYWIGRMPPVENDLAYAKAEFLERIAEPLHRSQNQSQEEVYALKKKYEHSVFGKFYVWDLVNSLSKCIDPLDVRLGVGSQEIHVLQILEAMEADGITDPNILVLGIIHDLAKVLLLPHEPPENVCFNTSIIGDYEPGIGLDNCTLTWCQDEFLYSRMKDHVPDHIAWVIRYHGIDIPKCDRYMDERDRDYTECYLRAFKNYDGRTKSFYKIPKKKIEDYHYLIEDAFPKPILF